MKPRLLFGIVAFLTWFAILVLALGFGSEKVEQPIRMRVEVANEPTYASTTTTETTTTTVAIRHRKKGRCLDFEQVLADYGLQPVRVFSYIAWRESRCIPDAMNTTLNRDGSFDSGLLQINSSWKTVTLNICGGGLELLVVLDCNLRVAKYLLDNGGLAHWAIDEKDLTFIIPADKLAD